MSLQYLGKSEGYVHEPCKSKKKELIILVMCSDIELDSYP